MGDSISNIPVYLGSNFDSNVGVARITEEDTIVLEIKGEKLVQSVAELLRLDQIRMFSVIFNYVRAEPKVS